MTEADTEKNNCRISVVIPAYNSEETIERAVMSALDQSYENVEVIVIDDGSEDGTLDVLRALKSSIGDEWEGKYRNKELRVFHKKNGGVSAARNDGIRIASGDWLVTLDADDYIDRDMLKRMQYVASENDTELCICGFRMLYDDGSRETFTADAEVIDYKEEFINNIFTELYEKHLISTHSNKLFNLPLIRERKIYYNELLQVNEDIDFCLRYIKNCSSIAVIKGVYLNYIQHGAGGSLINTFRPYGIDSSLLVLKAMNEMLDPIEVDDKVVNRLNNRMLEHICSFAGLMYYRSGYSEEKKLAELQKLCGREIFIDLLKQTTPDSLKNAVAVFLLKHRMVNLYHRLCLMLYRSEEQIDTASDADKKSDTGIRHAAIEESELAQIGRELEDRAAEYEDDGKV